MAKKSKHLEAAQKGVSRRIIAPRRTHAPAAGNRRLAHSDAFLAGAVIIRVVLDTDLRRRLDNRGEKVQAS